MAGRDRIDEEGEETTSQSLRAMDRYWLGTGLHSRCEEDERAKLHLYL